MPIRVEISVNSRHVETVHIGRLTGSTHPDSLNKYMIVKSDTYPTPDEWLDGIGFDHVYGDGITVCVEKALSVLNKEQK